eukprot:6196935-Pleurochrysis_carterae.AAC.1
MAVPTALESVTRFPNHRMESQISRARFSVLATDCVTGEMSLVQRRRATDVGECEHRLSSTSR